MLKNADQTVWTSCLHGQRKLSPDRYQWQELPSHTWGVKGDNRHLIRKYRMFGTAQFIFSQICYGAQSWHVERCNGFSSLLSENSYIPPTFSSSKQPPAVCSAAATASDKRQKLKGRRSRFSVDCSCNTHPHLRVRTALVLNDII